MNDQEAIDPSRTSSAVAYPDPIGAANGRGRTTAALCFALLLFAGVAAIAQDPPSSDAPADPPAEEAESEEAAEAPGTPFTEVMTVTANKREEDVLDVAAAVSVIGEDRLENLSADQLTDFAAYVPGLQVTSLGTPGQTIISLRGIAPLSSGSTVATYVGEAPLGSSGLYQRATAFALDLLPYDVERVEVLRGPQGTLYGAGAMGGLLKYVPRDPELSTRQVRVGGGLSDVEGAGDPGGDLYVTANVPLAVDRFALRASYALNDIPGFIDNGLNGEENLNDGQQESARLAMLWQASDSVRLKMDVMRQTIDTDNNSIVALAPGTLEPLYGDLENAVAIDEPFEKEIDLYMATLDWDLGWGALTSATAYSDAGTRQRQDATFLVGEFPLLLGLPPGLSFFDLVLDLEKLTQELRLTSTASGRFDWQVGAFYSDEEADNTQTIRLTDTSGTPVAGLDPLAVLALPSDFEELAAFGNVTFHLTERFAVDAGGRYSANDQTFAQVVTDGILVPIGTTPGGSDEDVFTWSLGPSLRLTDETMTYARVATGYQPGGPNVALPGVPAGVDSSRLTSYELGLKSQLADRRWLVDLAAFYLDWTDIQLGASAGGVSWLINGGEAVSQGIELSTAFQPTDRLQIQVNGAYTDATLSNDQPSIGGREGDRLPYIPELSWSMLADYHFVIGGGWSAHTGAGYRWVDDQVSAVESDPTALPLDSYGAVDLNADVFNARWSIRAFARNVTDERAYQSINAVTSLVTGVTHHVAATPIQPRTFGIELGTTF